MYKQLCSQYIPASIPKRMHIEEDDAQKLFLSYLTMPRKKKLLFGTFHS